MKLTSSILKKIIEEEVSKLSSKTASGNVKADEVDADELADSLDKKIDYVKALKLEEKRLQKRLTRISEIKTRATNDIARAARALKK